ncbi:nucleotidyl transferase AbiEii/AbiGii toxin family protein [Actinoplanes sp. NPDC049548]|uniref:nucleotidyl transferase AbiEii/AbiGii toxin family protein n=1 Tax=Actinoplanes sp. NPDC049548 TaxID=3155152 RepID=UPI003429DDC0
MRLYALEGFLARLAVSSFAQDLVLKGGVLLAAYATRRPTRDIDLEGLRLPNDVEHLLSVVAGIASVPQDDGLIFDLGTLRAETIRDSDDDVYSGVRIHLQADLATARLTIGIDISVGDPIIPAPQVVALPRLLVAEPVRLKGYPMTMVLAEKIITAVQRGKANTRWRDFADIYLLIGRHDVEGQALATALTGVAEYR